MLSMWLFRMEAFKVSQGCSLSPFIMPQSIIQTNCHLYFSNIYAQMHLREFRGHPVGDISVFIASG